MDMGVLKPSEMTRTTTAVVTAEAGLGSQTVARHAERAAAFSAPASISTVSAAAIEQVPSVEKKALETAVGDMQSFVQSVNRDINFQLDEESGKTIVNVTERATGEIIRQIPSEEALRIAENLAEVRSFLFKAEA